METRKLLQADYLDIIYDNRNKQYGGYELRKNYDRRLKKGAFFLLLGVVALSSFSFIESEKNHTHASTNVIQPRIVELTPPPPKPELKVIPEQPVEPPKQVRAKIFTDPVITKDPIMPDQQMTENKDLANFNPGNNSHDGDSLDVAPEQPGKGGTGIVTPPATVATTVFTYVEQMPQFAGNMEAYIASHLHYPDAARSNGIDGRVVIQFVINEDGSVTDAKAVRTIGGGCDEEALRVVNSMPKWKPGKQNGIPVRVLFTLPIKFVLN